MRSTPQQAPRHPDYERQDSGQTLGQGIAAYFQAYPGLAQGRGMSAEAVEFFRCHDAVHVVYGCGNALDDEAIVKIASIAGTTGGLAILRGYRLHESLEIYRHLRVADVARSVAHSSYLVPRTLWRCAWQARKWPWDHFAGYMQEPLRDIRREFGIRVAHSDRPHR